MKTLIIIKSLLICVALAATTTYALMTEGSFSGTARSIKHDIKDVKTNLSGYWDNISLSRLVSESFWFETDEALASTFEFPANSFYQPSANVDSPHQSTDEWISSDFIIDEQNNSVAGLPLLDSTPTDNGIAWLGNVNAPFDSASAEALYRFGSIHIGAATGTAKGNYTGYIGGGSRGWVGDVSSAESSLNADQLEQTLEWYGVGNSSSSTQGNPELGAITDDRPSNPNEWIDTVVDPEAKPAISVPAPSPLLLLLLCALALTWKSSGAQRRRAI